MIGMNPGIYAQDTVYYEIWNLDNLDNIGGHTLTYTGNPQVVATDEGNVIQFDGVGDRLLIDANPIGEAKEFTVELVFWADTYVDANKDPRFVHIQDPEDSKQKRVMMELRVTPGNECYLDGFILTDIENLPLIDESLVHPTEKWLHAAITYKDGVFKTYMEGKQELSGNVAYQDYILEATGKTSLGARMDERNYFKGKMKTLKVTRKALDPSEFLINDTIDTSDTVTNSIYLKDIESTRLSLYPVPADQTLQIQSTGVGSKPIHVSIKDLVGKELYSEKVVLVNDTPIAVNTSDLQSGIYLVQVHSEDTSETRSIVVHHR